MPSLPRIFGWIPHPTPPGASPLSTLTTSFKSAEKLSPEGSEVVLSPFSSTSSLSPDGGLQPEPEPVRRGDPEWVARPRNPFIIFRCEYSREHAKEGKRVRRLPGSQADKTLSKRAAEAWHQLSAEEKNRFKKLADGEREEHARRYPNYRFRPVKRSTGKNRFVHAPKLQSQPTKPSASETIVAPTPRYPPPPNTTKSSPSSSPLSNSPAPLNMSMVKATRRRSASAPSLPYIQPLNTGFVDTAVLPRLNVKRSRSLMANRTSMTKTGQASTYENLPFDPRLFDLSDSWEEYNIPDSLSSEIGSVELPFNDQFSNFDSPVPLSPLSAATSPLTSWRGESDILRNQLASTHSPWSSPAVGMDDKSLQQYTDYQSADIGLATNVVNYPSNNDPWTTSSSNLSAAMDINTTSVTQGTLYAPLAPYDQAEHAYVLREYGLGLDMQEGDTLTMPVADENHELAALDGNSYF